MSKSHYFKILQLLSTKIEQAAVQVSNGNQREAGFAIKGLLDIIHEEIKNEMLNGVTEDAD